MTSRYGWLTAASLKKLVRTTLVGAAVAAVACTMAPTGPQAFADPTPGPTTIAEAKSLVAKLEHQSSDIEQKYVAAQEKFAATEKSLAGKKRDLAAQEAKVAELRKAVGAIALTQFQSRGIDTTTKLLVASSPEGLLRDLSLQERLNDRQRATLQSYQIQQANLADLQRAAETDTSTMETATKEMAAALKESEAKVSEAEQILQRLTAEQRRRLEAERQAAQEQAAAAAAAAAQQQTRSTSNANSRSEQRTPPKKAKTETKTKSKPKQTSSVPVSGRAGAAVASAISKLGSPYRMGGTGPSYDCSGLTMTSWRAAGVSIPRTSGAQYGASRRISRSQLQPGDLVFYYSGISHVAIYVGNGTIIHAPNRRTVVKYDPIGLMPIVGYGRVG